MILEMKQIQSTFDKREVKWVLGNFSKFCQESGISLKFN